MEMRYLPCNHRSLLNLRSANRYIHPQIYNFSLKLTTISIFCNQPYPPYLEIIHTTSTEARFLRENIFYGGTA